MNINDIFKTVQRMQPTLTRIQTLCNSETMQKMVNTHRALQENLVFSTKMLKQLQQPLLSKQITQSFTRLGSLQSMVDKNIVDGMSSRVAKIFKNNERILGVGGIANILKSFDFKYTFRMSSIVNAQFKDFQKTTQTFYGLQVSTTVTRNDKNTSPHIETQSFSCTTTLSQAEHQRIVSEKDYIILQQQEVILTLNMKNEQLQNRLSYTLSEPTHKQIASKGGKNSYQNYKPLREKVKELCVELKRNNKQSARQLCYKVAKIMESKHRTLLTDFQPYIQSLHKDNCTDWRSGTFYNWCNKICKE
jgi:hypothetical protein